MSSQPTQKWSFTGPIQLANGNTVLVSCYSESESTECLSNGESSVGTKNKFTCSVCGSSHSKKSNLKRHVEKKHPSNTDQISLMTKKFKFSCEFCQRRFNIWKDFTYHQSKMHNIKLKNKCIYTCPVCFNNFPKQDIIEHMKTSHEFENTETKLQFSSFNKFSAWKVDMEQKTKTRFIKCSARYNDTTGAKYYYFQCHRSGCFVSKSKGIRNLKLLGSKKINAYCPATIKVIESRDGDCIVKFLSTHIGHTNELGHLFLTDAERKYLASKIAAKMPFEVILDEIRDSISESGLQRLHLLTKKDLHNIKSSFNLSCGRKRGNDVSVEPWVQEIQNAAQPDEPHAIVDQENDLISELSQSIPSNALTLEQHRQELSNMYHNLIQSLSSPEQMSVMYRHFKSLLPQLNVTNVQNASYASISPSSSSSPGKKNVIPQKSLLVQKKEETSKFPVSKSSLEKMQRDALTVINKSYGRSFSLSGIQ